MSKATYLSFSDDEYQYAIVVDNNKKNHIPLKQGETISLPNLDIDEVNFKKLKITYRHWRNRWVK